MSSPLFEALAAVDEMKAAADTTRETLEIALAGAVAEIDSLKSELEATRCERDTWRAQAMEV